MGVEGSHKMKIENRYIELTGTSWLAAFWSYSINHSILWALLHFILGPAYLAYRIAFHTNLLPK